MMDLLAQQMNDVIDLEVQKLMPALYTVVAFIFLVFTTFTAIVWKLTRDNKESRESFLTFISHQNDVQKATDHDRSKALKELGDGCHQFQRDLAERTHGVFAEVTSALHQNTQALGANTETLNVMARIIERKV